MGCLFMFVCLCIPRISLLFIWLLTNWFSKVCDGWFWPFMGFLFMPYTTLIYLGAMLKSGEMTFGWIVLLVIGIFLDLGASIKVKIG